MKGLGSLERVRVWPSVFFKPSNVYVQLRLESSPKVRIGCENDAGRSNLGSFLCSPHQNPPAGLTTVTKVCPALQCQIQEPLVTCSF